MRITDPDRTTDGSSETRRKLATLPLMFAAAVWLSVTVALHSHGDFRDHQDDCLICAINATPVEVVSFEIPEPEPTATEPVRENPVQCPLLCHASFHLTRAPPALLF